MPASANVVGGDVPPAFPSTLAVTVQGYASSVGRAYLILEIDGDKAGREVREYGHLSDDAVAALLGELSASEGGTLTVPPSDRDSHLIVAVDGPNAFIGLDGPDGIFEYEGSPDREGTLTMRIAGQEATLEARFVVTMDAATDCIQGWLNRDDSALPASWRRR